MARTPESDGIYFEGVRNFARNQLRLPTSVIELASFIGKDRHTTTRRLDKLAPGTDDLEGKIIKMGLKAGVHRAVVVDGKLETDAGFIPVVSLPGEHESRRYDPYSPEAMQALPDERLIHLVKAIGEVLVERFTKL